MSLRDHARLTHARSGQDRTASRLASLTEREDASIETLAKYPCRPPSSITLLVTGVPVDDSIGYRIAKRACDIAASLTGLVILGPLMLVTGLAIKLADGGPILMRQRRIGRFGVSFCFYKFRCTQRGAESAPQSLHAGSKLVQDPPLTKLGRFLRKYSIDELPQLVSVLRGQMSVIGPRPHLDREVAHYKPEQRRRLLVKPGLVCIREVSGRAPMSFDEWINIDLGYVDHRSLFLDAKIFLKSIPVVIRGEDAL